MDTRLLFLGFRGSCRCRMAGAIARARAVSGIRVTSAMVEPAQMDPLAEEVMAEGGLLSGGELCVTLSEILRQEYDIVVVVCPQAAAHLPLLPGRPSVVQWVLPDPACFSQDPGTRRDEYRNLLETIRRQVANFFEQGCLQAIIGVRTSSDMILDSISDGVLVHDMQRRIVMFNRAAEVITGRLRQDVVGCECHQVFGDGFCGGKCVLAQGVCSEPDFEERREQIVITTTDGESRTVDARIRPLREAAGRWVGLVIVFHDVTRECALARRVGEMQSFAGIVGRDGKMQEVFDLIRDVADSAAPILIRGESGTGKELVAAAIHNEGPRSSKPFIAVNCGALPEGLLESELFGHVRGSFTGAIRDKKGRFELADGGTIFLDEIGDITPAMQVRLLRVLQEGVMQRVGSETAIKVDVRVISATHRDLQKEIAAARFREDLFYRLNVVPIWIPPLRERMADIPLLVDHLLARFVSLGHATPVRVTAEALDVLLSYDWPGNVRELQNWLQFALVKCHGGDIRPEHFPPRSQTDRSAATGRAATAVSRRTAVRAPLTQERVRDALAQCGGNRRDTARALGVGRATLYRFFDAHPEAQLGACRT